MLVVEKKLGSSLRDQYTPQSGMEWIIDLREKTEKERQRMNYVPPKKVLGSFGITDDAGHERILHWVRSPYGPKSSGNAARPQALSRFGKDMLESMFKNW